MPLANVLVISTEWNAGRRPVGLDPPRLFNASLQDRFSSGCLFFEIDALGRLGGPVASACAGAAA